MRNRVAFDRCRHDADLAKCRLGILAGVRALRNPFERMPVGIEEVNAAGYAAILAYE